MPSISPRVHRPWRVRPLALSLLCGIAPLVACNDSESFVTAADGASTPISQIIVQPKVDTIFARDTLQITDAIQLKATVVGFSGTALPNAKVRWSTTDTNLVSVDSLGVVRPRRLGTATVTAQSGDKTDKATVAVVWATQRVAVSSSFRSYTGLPAAMDTIFLGDAPAATDFVRLRGVAIGQKGDTLTGVAFSWRSRLPSVATVDPTTGVVRPASQTSFGTATIEVTGAGLTTTKQVVIVSAVRALNVTPRTDTIFVMDPVKPTDTRKLTATPVLWPSAPPVPVTVTWGSSAPAVATVNDTGLVTAKALGTTTINATAAGFTQPSTITVLPFVKQVNLTSNLSTARGVVVGDTVRYSAVGIGYSGQPVSGVKYTWVSSNPAFATIDSTGLARFIAPGSVQFLAVGDFVTGTTLPTVTVLANTYQSITAGTDYSCAIGQLGRLDCWGRAGENQLGTSGDSTCFNDIGGASVSCTLHPKRAAAPEAFVAMSAGDATTCGISETGRAYCWGAGSLGQIGNGRGGSAGTPTLVTSGLTFSLSSARAITLNGYTTYSGTISAGGNHACAITVTQLAYCWGADGSAQLGDGTMRTSSTTPIPVGGVNSQQYRYISAGSRHTCALTTSGAAYCWGLNNVGQAGSNIGVDTIIYTPTAVATANAFAMISASPFDGHTCGVTTGGAVFCWGANELGQSTGFASGAATPTAVGGGSYSFVSAGAGFTCALRTDGGVDCWGRNESGQLGGGGALTPTGAMTRVVAPQVIGANGALSTISQVTYVAVAAGQRHACGLATDGWVYCWGSDVVGALGDQLQALAQSRPTRVYRVP